MKGLISQMKWHFILLHRNNLILISVMITLVYGLIFYFIRDLGISNKILTLFVYNDPVLIGLFFVGVSVILDKNQGVLSALNVTPISPHVYLISRILTLSMVGWLCALGMGIFLLGTTFNLFHYSFGVFFTCLIFSIIGVFVVSFGTAFLIFLLRSIPLMLVFSAPLFNYFGLTDIDLFSFFPIQGSLDLINTSYNQGAAPVKAVVYAYFTSIVWIPMLYAIAYYVFVTKIIKGGG